MKEDKQMATSQPAMRRRSIRVNKELKDKGICIRCRTARPTKGKVTCKPCRVKNNNRLKKYREKQPKWKKQKVNLMC